MEKKYRELFDGIHASERLRTEVMHMNNTEHPNTQSKRSVPAAALIAAVLVAALAGTALAVEYFGRVDVEIGEFLGTHKKGYNVYMPEERIPVGWLSDEVLAAAPGAGASRYVKLPFDSWSDAEAFLGLEVADNAELEQMWKRRLVYETYRPGASLAQAQKKSPCLVSIVYSPQQLPENISIRTCYQKNNCFITESAAMITDCATDYYKEIIGISVPMQNGAEFQEYVTPSGMEVTIYKAVTSDSRQNNREYDSTQYNAHFVKNGALFTLSLYSDEAYQIGRESVVFYDPWETLIEILDAYE